MRPLGSARLPCMHVPLVPALNLYSMFSISKKLFRGRHSDAFSRSGSNNLQGLAVIPCCLYHGSLVRMHLYAGIWHPAQIKSMPLQPWSSHAPSNFCCLNMFGRRCASENGMQNLFGCLAQTSVDLPGNHEGFRAPILYLLVRLWRDEPASGNARPVGLWAMRTCSNCMCSSSLPAAKD